MVINKDSLKNNTPAIVKKALETAVPLIDSRLNQSYFLGGSVEIPLNELDLPSMDVELEDLFVDEIKKLYGGDYGWTVQFDDTDDEGPACLIFS